MSSRIGLEVSLALAEAVGVSRADVIAAYPITPQTHIVEHLAELVANGGLDAEYVAVESEHSAISACLGSSAAGARTFTATASQGLAFMHEILFIASSMRLPLVMAVANRALSAPINILADHSDVMPERDIGWIQLFAENGQEVHDMTLQAFKLAEHSDVLLPVMINLDGFSLSHMIEPVTLISQEEADQFLPACTLEPRLDPSHPRSLGSFGGGDVYTEIKKQQDVALSNAPKVLNGIWADFSSQFGRSYQAVSTYKMDKAEIALVTMGAVSETARSAIDQLWEEGIHVGLVRIRLWRPFPIEELRSHLSSVSKVAVLDRMLSPGSCSGPVALEVKSILYGRTDQPQIYGYVAGLGGRELSRRTFHEIVTRSIDAKGSTETSILLDVREV
ncbi:MAG: pyruvate ferredoxin oxidoreductase [Desulfovermiculus sp.]|nr:pyruvate ferredoxin oxidoreductase [Desulfovermiculus sp.]